MNQFKQLLLLFVSISGLISCSPDNSSTPTPSREENKLSSRAVEQILIQQSDGSFRVLEKGLNNLKVGSHL
jgi:hypothetical protein